MSRPAPQGPGGFAVCGAGLLGVLVGGGPPAALLVAPLVFWAPSGPAAREIATRELRSEWSISRPAQALRTLRTLHAGSAWHAVRSTVLPAAQQIHT